MGISRKSGGGAEAGDIKYMLINTVPAGWLRANGAIVSRNAFARLFRAIGTQYGAGDGVSTFQLPDLRGLFIRSLDDGRGVDVGRGIGTIQDSQNKKHSHTFVHYLQTGNGVGATMRRGFYLGTEKSAYTEETSSEGGLESRPINFSALVIIKY